MTIKELGRLDPSLDIGTEPLQTLAETVSTGSAGSLRQVISIKG